MQTATLTWVDPAPPVTGLEVSMQVQGASAFTVLQTVAPGVQKATIPDLADGTYVFRVVALNNSARSAGVTTSGTAKTPDAVPADVTSLAVTFS